MMANAMEPMVVPAHLEMTVPRVALLLLLAFQLCDSAFQRVPVRAFFWSDDLVGHVCQLVDKLEFERVIRPSCETLLYRRTVLVPVGLRLAVWWPPRSGKFLHWLVGI